MKYKKNTHRFKLHPLQANSEGGSGNLKTLEKFNGQIVSILDICSNPAERFEYRHYKGTWYLIEFPEGYKQWIRKECLLELNNKNFISYNPINMIKDNYER